MSKSKNLGGFITIPIPGKYSGEPPMTFEEYKKECGLDLMDILTDNPKGGAVPMFKVNKPIFTEDIDRYYPTIPLILPIVTCSNVVEDVEVLQIVHAAFGETGVQAGFYMMVNWTNKTISVGEY